MIQILRTILGEIIYLREAQNILTKQNTVYPDSAKTAIRLMYAGTATGEMLPIYVVYKAEHLWDLWCEVGPDGKIYNRSRSGWFESVCFEDCFNMTIVPFCRYEVGQKVIYYHLTFQNPFCENTKN